MPRLGERKETIDTYLRLPVATRAQLEAAIDGDRIKTLTDAVIAAAKLLPKRKETKR